MDGAWITLCCLGLVLSLWCQQTTAEAKKGDDHGRWGPWGQWSPCSATCGMGMMKRERPWIPAAKDALTQKKYTSSSVISCTNSAMRNCPVDGVWSGWTSWSACTQPCGQGVKSRRRECRGITYGGKPCNGETKEKAPCKRDPCPVLPRNFQMSQCSDKNFTCASKRMCILSSQKCDDTVQCHDGSDEVGCPRKFIGPGGIRYVLNRNGGASTASLATFVKTLMSVVVALCCTVDFNLWA